MVPLVTRSQRFPNAPPRIKERAIVVGLSLPPLFHRNSETTTTDATEKAISPALRQGDVDSANMLNAAPVFSQCVSWKNPGMMERSCPKGSRRTTSHLVNRSRAMTARAIISWRRMDAQRADHRMKQKMAGANLLYWLMAFSSWG